LTSLSPAEVQALPGATSMQDGEAIEILRLDILTPDAEAAARRLLAADAFLSGLEITGAGLEDAFWPSRRRAVQGGADPAYALIRVSIVRCVLGCAHSRRDV
jgi:hypothetical protein